MSRSSAQGLRAAIDAAKDRESATENRAGVVSDTVGLPANVDVPILFLDERLGLLSLGMGLIPAGMPFSTLVTAETLTLVLDGAGITKGGNDPLSTGPNPAGSEKDVGNDDDPVREEDGDGMEEVCREEDELIPVSELVGLVCAVCCCSN